MPAVGAGARHSVTPASPANGWLKRPASVADNEASPVQSAASAEPAPQFNEPAMYLYAQDDRRSPCPTCGQTIRRIHRSADDRQVVNAAALRRYQCTNAECGWQGLLPRQPSLPQRRSPAVAPAAPVEAPAPRAGERRVRLAPMLLAGLSGMVFASAATIALMGAGPAEPQRARPRPQQAGKLGPGDHHEGVAMNASHPLLQLQEAAPEGVTPLALRQGCAWGKPGRNPYRGTVDEALVTAKLPAEVVQRIAMKVKNGQLDDRLEISNAGIRTSRDGREFEPRNVALTYGKTLCVNSRVNFPNGHIERASLFEAADKRGNLYSVMVPDVCGNVSVLGARMERGRKRLALAVLAETSHDAPAVINTGAGEDESPAPFNTVPEPSSLASTLAALGAATLAGAWARRRRRAGAPPRA